MQQKMFNDKMLLGKYTFLIFQCLELDFSFLTHLILINIGGGVGINNIDQKLMK